MCEDRIDSHWALRDHRADRGTMTWAVCAAIALHVLVLLAVRFPEARPLPRPVDTTHPPSILVPKLPPPPMPVATVVDLGIRERLLPVPFPEPAPPRPVAEPAAPVVELVAAPMTVQLGEPQPPARPAGPLTPGRDHVTYPSLIPESKIAPNYPELARQARLSSRVIVQAVVTEDGSVGELEVLLCDHPGVGFEEAAIEAIRLWRYEPALLFGKPVEVYFTVIVEFELQ